jgi:hypothetical protein
VSFTNPLADVKVPVEGRPVALSNETYEGVNNSFIYEAIA